MGNKFPNIFIPYIYIYIYIFIRRGSDAVHVCAQSCPTLCNPMDCSLSGSSVHGILQARILEWVALPFSRNLPNPGLNLHLLLWQVGSLPAAPPGKLLILGIKKKKKDKYPLLLSNSEGNDLSICHPSSPSATLNSILYIKLECFRETDENFCFIERRKSDPQYLPFYLDLQAASPGLVFNHSTYNCLEL